MPSLTHTGTLFPYTPEELRSASERVMQFWVGAMTPLWAPFFAAASFGVGAWAVTRTLDRAGDLAAGLPQVPQFAATWPGFTPPPPEENLAAAEVAAPPADAGLQVLIDPVTANPVVPAAVEAIAEPAPVAAEAVVKAPPKAIAKDLAVARPARPKAGKTKA